MIRKIGAVLMALAVAASFSPSLADAASSSKKDKQKYKKYTKQLKKLPNYASPKGKVNSLSKKSTKLLPQNGAKVYKIAAKKFPLEVNKKAADRLQAVIAKIVGNSNIPDKQKNKIVKKLDQIFDKIPTPTPYQAWVGSELIYA